MSTPTAASQPAVTTEQTSWFPEEVQPHETICGGSFRASPTSMMGGGYRYQAGAQADRREQRAVLQRAAGRHRRHNTALQPNGVFNIFSAFTPNCIVRNNVFDAPGRLMLDPRADTPKSPAPDVDYNFITTFDRDDWRGKHGVHTDWRIGPLFVASYALEFYPTSTTMRVRGGKIPVRFG